MSDRIPNEIITAAERVLRHLNDGREPYAPSVMPMARALVELARDPAFILPAAQDLLDEADCASPRAMMHIDVSGVPVGSLLDAYKALLATRKPAGEEGG